MVRLAFVVGISVVILLAIPVVILTFGAGIVNVLVIRVVILTSVVGIVIV